MGLFDCIAQDVPVKRNALMTVFVHGTIKPAEFSFASIVKIMRDNVDNSLYSKAVGYMREDHTFYYGQAMQELGLKEINMSLEAPFSTARTIALMYNLQLDQLGNKPDINLYYTFGWNGLLSDTKRYEEAELFYEKLSQELARLAQNNIHPIVRVIAYSHGANVTLYLPAVRDNNPSYKSNPLFIDELVTIAAPVQKETDYLINDPLFKKVYHVYSTEDNVQVWDLFSSRQLFSKRKFTHRSDFEVPEKLHQVRIRVTKDIKWRHKAKELKAPHHILETPGIKLVHKDPGHTEMWNFQWGAYWYRDSFPLKPLPVMTIIPTILHTVDAHHRYKNLTFDYAPTENGILLRSKQARFKKVFAFLTPDTQKALWNVAQKYRPKDYTIESQQKQVAIALKKAQNYLAENQQYQKPHNKTLALYMKQISLGIFDSIPPVKGIGKMRLASTKR